MEKNIVIVLRIPVSGFPPVFEYFSAGWGTAEWFKGNGWGTKHLTYIPLRLTSYQFFTPPPTQFTNLLVRKNKILNQLSSFE
jgi:hypothetical protein